MSDRPFVPADPGPPSIIGRIISYVAPNFVSAVVHAAGAIIIIGFGATLWEMLEPHPVRSAAVVSTDPPNRVIDRATSGHLAVVRHVCASRSSMVRVVREWIDEYGGRIPTLDDWAWLEEGCRNRPPVHVWPPATAAQGLYRYRVTLEWCNSVKCRSVHLPDVELQIVGDRPVIPHPPENNRF